MSRETCAGPCAMKGYGHFPANTPDRHTDIYNYNIMCDNAKEFHFDIACIRIKDGIASKYDPNWTVDRQKNHEKPVHCGRITR